jgi:iron complex outermembrane receptor protein
MIDRIEILKDGASSIYGSDAVAGVVNVILDTDLDGGEVNFTGIGSIEGGGESFRIDGAWGHSFDRGNIMVAADYYKREALNWGDRDYLNCAQDLVFEGGPNGRLLDIIDPATGESKCFNQLNAVYDRLVSGGRFVSTPGSAAGGGPFGIDPANFHRVGLSYAQVASLMPGATQAQIEAAWRQSTAEVPNNPSFFGSRNAISPVERYTLMATGSFDITPDVEAYGEFMYHNRQSSTASYRQLFPNVSGANANNPFAQTARSIISIPTTTEQDVDYYRAVAGIRGDLSFLNGWSYDLYAQTGKSDAIYGNDIIYNDRVLATTGAAGCNPALITISGPVANCVAVNYFRPSTVATGEFTPEEAAFLFVKEFGTTTYEQQLVNGVVTGDLFELPAGPLAAAFGFEWRHEEIDDTPGFNARNSNLWGQTSAGRTAGDDTIMEYFTEVEAPLVRGVTLMDDVSLNGSYRWTEYDSYGKNETYKFGLNWQFTPEYRFRASYGTSFRAPALYELYLANQTGFLAQTGIDPCIQWDSSSNPFIVQNCGPSGDNLPTGWTNPNSSALIVTGGGIGVLDPEESTASVYGFIWTPNWIDLSVALDYYQIEVSNQVSQFGAANIVGACYIDPVYQGSPFCDLFTRELTPGATNFGQITQVNNSYVNLNSQITEGLDLTLRYEHEFSFGTFRLDVQGAWTFQDEINFFGGAAEDFNGELVEPDFTAGVNLRFDRGDWTYFWDVDMVSRASNDEDFGGNIFGWRGTPYAAYYYQKADFYALHNASIRYQTDRWTLQVGMDNVFNEPPPKISTAGHFARLGITPLTNTYDIIGRAGWVSIGRRF